MKYNWGNAAQDRSPEQRAEARFRRKSRQIRLRGRMDMVLLRIAAVFVLLLVGGWFLGVEIGFRQGLFDPPPLRPLSDRRLLVNIRDDIIDKPLLDSVYHPPEESIFFSQAGGRLHRYAPRTGLWRRETIELIDHLLDPDIFLLRSGSGADPRSRWSGSDPDPDSLWGVTRGGGLVHRGKGNWRVLVGDSLFTGSRRVPVSSKQLTSAAVSRDGRWLVVGTRRDGVGIYHLETKHWLNLEHRFFETLPSPQVTHLTFCRDHFWIGGSAGLASLRMEGQTPYLTHFPGFSGQIRDMDVDSDERLWVLEKRKNKQGGAGLLRISRVASGDAAHPPYKGPRSIRYSRDQLNAYPQGRQGGSSVEGAAHPAYKGPRSNGYSRNQLNNYSPDRQGGNSVDGVAKRNIEYQAQGLESRKESPAGSRGLIKRLINEQNIYPGLTFEDLHFAYYHEAQEGTASGFLILAGDAGLFVYDTALHSWQRFFDKPVLSAAAQPDRQRVFFGYDGGIGILGLASLKSPRLLPISGQKMTRLKPGKPGEMLALSASGRLYTLRRNKAIESFAAQVKRVDPADWQGALTFGDTVLFTGQKDSLVHNIVTRGYKKIASADLPEWLTRTRPGPKSLTSGDMTYIVSEAEGKTDVFAIDTKAAADSRFEEGAHKGTLSGSVTLMRDWQGNGMVLRGGRGGGQIFRFSPWKETLTGAQMPEMNGIPFYDAAPFEQGVMAATYSGLRFYDYQRRAWRRYKNVPIVSGFPAELASAAGQLFIRTSRGSLTVLRAGDNFSTLIKESRFDFPDAELSDVMEADGRLFLAGSGWVYRYDPDLRAITDSWKIGAGGAVKLAGLVGSRPLSLCRGKAYVGSDALDPEAGEVVNLSVGPDYAWTIRKGAAHPTPHLYLKAYPAANPFSVNDALCFFRNPGAGQGIDSILDAVELPDREAIAVSTSKGLRFYSPRSRSWYGSEHGGGELYALGEHLLIAGVNKDNLFDLTAVKPADLRLPGDGYTSTFVSRRSRGALADPFTAPVTFRRAQTFPALQYAVNKSDGKLAYITPEGSVIEWRSADESRRELLAAAGEQPVSTNLRRLFYRDNAHGSYLLCTAAGNIWRYDLEKRTWRKIPIDIPGAADISISGLGDRDTAVVKTAGGEFFMYDFDRSRVQVFPGRTSVKQVFGPGAGFGSPAENLIDVQQRGLALWTFVLKDRIKYFYPLTRRWVEVRIDGLSGESAFCQIQNRGIIKANNGRTYWVAVKPGPHPRQFARYDLKTGESTAVDSSGSIWRLTSGGELFKQPLSKQGAYLEESILFEQPFLLEPGRLQGAYRWGDLVFFDIGERMRVLDAVRYREVPLPEAARDFGFIVEARRQGGLLRLRNVSGRFLLLAQKREGYDMLVTVRGEAGGDEFDEEDEASEAGEDPLPGAIEDSWPTLKTRVVRLSNGSSAYDPLTRLSVNSSGELLAEGHSRAKRLASSGTAAVDMLPPALDAGWLQWQRESRDFRVETTGGPVVLSRREFIKNNKLIFEEVDALMVETGAGETADLAGARFIAANSHGAWTYNKDNLSLDDRGIRFRPLSWQRPVSASHGYFIAPGAVYSKDGQRLPADREHIIRFGDVTLIERLALSRVRGHIAASGAVDIDAFAPRGFAWDQNRRGLAYTQSGLLLQSDAGIHPVDGYSGFEKPPGRGQLFSEDKGTVYFYTPANVLGNTAQRLNKSFSGGQGGRFYKKAPLAAQRLTGWVRRTPAGGKDSWQPLARSPWANRTLVDNNTWSWQLHNGQLNVRLKGKTHDFRVISGSSGLSFTCDRLLDAAAYKNRLFIKTGAFLEIADLLNGLPHLQAQRIAVRPVQRLRIMRRAGGRQTLVARQGGSYYTWDETANRFQPAAAADDPRRPRPIAQLPQDSPLLRFTLDSGRIRKELQISGSSGSGWAPFRFSDRRFPFDVVTSMAARGDTLYLGTKAGLQVYSSLTQFLSLNSMSGFYGLRGRNGALQEVEKVGIPLDNPEVVLAYSPTQHIEIQPDGSIRSRGSAADLERRLRLQTGFWRWYTEKDDRLFVQYKEQRGDFSPASAAIISKGRMPHDHIVDIAAFDDRAFTIWSSGWISIYPGLNIEINDRVINQNQQTLNPQRFAVFYENTAGETAAIPRGLYLLGSGTLVWQYRGGEAGNEITWAPVTGPALAAAITSHGSDDLIVNRRRLRLKPLRPGGRGVFTFEFRGLDGRWRPLPWKDGQVGIDKWSEFLFLEGRLWAGTAAGLTSFSRTAAGRVVIDPDNFIVIREPQVQGSIPEITDMTAEAGGSVVVRCRGSSQQVYRGLLDGQRDSGVFTRLSGETVDPFVNKILVDQKENGFWEWKRVKCEDYHPGVLEGKLRGEKILLSGGRFSFDTINSLAFLQGAAAPPLPEGKNREGLRSIPQGLQVEIATDAGGYFRSAADLHAAHFYRPQMAGVNPADIREVRVNRRGGEEILGLRTNRGDFIHWGAKGVSGRTAQFKQYLCDDGFWRYEQGEPGLSIIANRGAGRGTQRRLEKGRFSDHVVIGLPVSARDKTGVYYLLPTRAGVLRLDRRFKAAGIYPVDTLKPAGSRVPNILFAAGKGTERTLIYGAEDHFYLLEQPGVVYPGLELRFPPGAELLAAADGPQDFVSLRWQKGEERGWSLLKYVNEAKRQQGREAEGGEESRISNNEYRTPSTAPEQRISKGEKQTPDGGQGTANSGQRSANAKQQSNGNANIYQYNQNDIFVNVSEFRKYDYYRMEMSAAEGWLHIRLMPTHLEALRYRTGAAAAGEIYRLDFPQPIQLLNPIVKGETLYLIGKRRLWEVNLDHILQKINVQSSISNAQ